MLWFWQWALWFSSSHSIWSIILGSRIASRANRSTSRVSMVLDYPINLFSASRIRCMGTRGYWAIAYCVELDTMDNLHGKRWIGVTAPSTHRYSTLFCQTVKLSLSLPLPVERSPIHIESSLSRSTSALMVMLDTYSQFRANNHSPRISCTYPVYYSTDCQPPPMMHRFHSIPRRRIPAIERNRARGTKSGS